MGHRTGKSWTIELHWTCSSCGHKNLGRHTDCQNCGSPKERDEKYEMKPDDPSSAAHVTDPSLLKLAKAGANYHCPYCGADVRAMNEVCGNCAARRHEDEEEAGEFDEEKVGLLTDQDEPESKPAYAPPKYGGGGGDDGGDSEDDPLPRRRFNWRAALIALGAVAAVAGIVWLCVFLFVPREVDATVAGVNWRIDAALRQKTLMHGEGWRSDMPMGTFNESCDNRQNGTEDCEPHECNCRDVPYDCNCTGGDSYSCNCRDVCTDNGNGFASCHQECDTCTTPRTCQTCYNRECDTCYNQCPVYEDWCSYDYHEWPVVQRDSTSGNDLEVSPPSLRAHGPDQRLDVNERYEVRFTDGEDNWTLRPDARNEFTRYPPDARWRIKVNRAGQVWPLRPLQ